MASNPANELSPEDQLIQSILSQAPDYETAQAMLVGAYGESGWNPYASGSGGGGAFGFTPPNYPAWLETAPPAEQVAAILPAYEQSAASAPAPNVVTNPAAYAEWIALGAEKPKYFSKEQGKIAAYNTPAQYGANTSYDVQNWSTIAGLTSGAGGTTPAQLANYLSQQPSASTAPPGITPSDPVGAALANLEGLLHGEGFGAKASLLPFGLASVNFGPVLAFGMRAIIFFLAIALVYEGTKVLGESGSGLVHQAAGNVASDIGRLSSGATTIASTATPETLAFRAGTKSLSKGSQRSSSNRTSSRLPSEDELAAAHAEGLYKGQRMGPNTARKSASGYIKNAADRYVSPKGEEF